MMIPENPSIDKPGKSNSFCASAGKLSVQLLQHYACFCLHLGTEKSAQRAKDE